MKKERNLWFVIALLIAVLSNSLIAQDREENVRFEKGHSSIKFKDSVKGHENIIYHIDIEKGHTMIVKLKHENPFLYFDIIPPAGQKTFFTGSLADDPDHWRGVLEKTGTYDLKVYLMRNEAKLDKNASFELDILVVDESEVFPVTK